MYCISYGGIGLTLFCFSGPELITPANKKFMTNVKRNSTKIIWIQAQGTHSKMEFCECQSHEIRRDCYFSDPSIFSLHSCSLCKVSTLNFCHVRVLLWPNEFYFCVRFTFLSYSFNRISLLCWDVRTLSFCVGLGHRWWDTSLASVFWNLSCNRSAWMVWRKKMGRCFLCQRVAHGKYIGYW